MKAEEGTGATGRPRWLWLCGLVAALCSFTANAQENSFIGSFTLAEVNSGGISVDWTIQSGNTCDGIDVERSSDSLNFTPVHHIDGICGSVDSSLPYHWFDAAPPELARVYYRLKLGFVGYSMVRSIFYEQLVESSQRIYPDPTRDETTLLLNVRPSSSIEVRLFNATGQLVLVRSVATGPKVELDLRALPAGTYIYHAVAEDRTFTGRMIKL